MSTKPAAGPDPNTLYPLEGYRRLCFLKNLIDHPQIEFGDYTYYNDFENVENFLKNVRYLFDFSGDKLIIKIRWWDWPADKITRCAHLLTGNDLDALERMAER